MARVHNIQQNGKLSSVCMTLTTEVVLYATGTTGLTMAT